MTEEQAFIEWKAEQYKHQCTEEELEFVEHLHNFPRYFKKTFLDGYHECQKEHEWHYADVPTSPINKVVLGYIKHYNSKLFCLVGWNGKWWYDARTWNDKVKLIAWCEIPKLPTELSKKWVDNYEDYQNASNDITFSQYPVYRGK